MARPRLAATLVVLADREVADVVADGNHAALPFSDPPEGVDHESFEACIGRDDRAGRSEKHR